MNENLSHALDLGDGNRALDLFAEELPVGEVLQLDGCCYANAFCAGCVSCSGTMGSLSTLSTLSSECCSGS